MTDPIDAMVAAYEDGMRDESKDETAREAWLRKELAAERKRREAAERERDVAKGYYDALHARIMSAEADNAALLQSLESAGHALSSGMAERAVAELLRQACRTHPGAALLELASLVRNYQHKDEATLADTFQRLMTERARIAEMVQPSVHAALRERMRALEKVRETLGVVAPVGQDGRYCCGGSRLAELMVACAAADALKPETK